MKKLALSGINTIIFDLGMVIIDLDKQATPIAFEKLCGPNYTNIMEKLNGEGFFEAYETGRISTDTFIERLQSEIGDGVKADQIKSAWNAMLMDIPEERFKILLEAKGKYRTYCLSNTNQLHIDFIFDKLKQERKLENLDPYFHKVYLSHEMKQRKPDPEIFETVVKEQGLKASETLFIDDTAEHLAGASSIGLKTFHLNEGLTLEGIWSN